MKKFLTPLLLLAFASPALAADLYNEYDNEPEAQIFLVGNTWGEKIDRYKKKKQDAEHLRLFKARVAKKYGAAVANDLRRELRPDPYKAGGGLFFEGNIYICSVDLDFSSTTYTLDYMVPDICVRKSELR